MKKKRQNYSYDIFFGNDPWRHKIVTRAFILCLFFFVDISLKIETSAMKSTTSELLVTS